MIETDLVCGCCLLGNGLISFPKGVGQGSSLSPGIADLVLICVEAKNVFIFVVDAKRWIIFILRYMDDIFVIIVSLLSRNILSMSSSICVRVKSLALDLRMQKNVDIKNAYMAITLPLKDEDCRVFAGIVLSWGGNRIIANLHVQENLVYQGSSKKSAALDR